MKKLTLGVAAVVVLLLVAFCIPATAQEARPREGRGDSASPPPPPPPPPPAAPSPGPTTSSRGGGGEGGRSGGGTVRGGGGESRVAVPRGESGGRVNNAGSRGRVEPSHVAPAPANAGGEGADRAENRGSPNYGRRRGDRTVVGEAVPRGTVPTVERPGRGGSGYPYIFDPYYGWGYGGSRYSNYWHYGSPYYWGAFGLGYFYYDPFWWSYPYYGAYGANPYGHGGYGGYGGAAYVADAGAVRLKVKPRDAKVFVNGYFEGYVDNFDGILQRLKVRPGPNRIEVRAEGFEPIVFDVNAVPGETITYKADMRRSP